MLSLALSGQQQRERLHEQQVLVRLRNLGVFSTRNLSIYLLYPPPPPQLAGRPAWRCRANQEDFTREGIGLQLIRGSTDMVTRV